MKLHTTSSAGIIQECRVMFGVKSESKSIFNCRRNVLRVGFDFKMANIRRIKSNNEYIISATHLTAQLTAVSTICVNVRKTSVAESQLHEMIVQHTNTKTA